MCDKAGDLILLLVSLQGTMMQNADIKIMINHIKVH